MPFRYSYLAMKWPFISFIFLRLLFYSPNYFWQLFFFLLCFCISFTLTFQFSHLFYYSLLLFVGVILSYSLFSHFTSFPLRVLLSHILFWGQGRAGNIWQLHAQEICSVQCLNLCFFLVVISGFWSDCLMPVTAWHVYSLDPPIHRDCFILISRNSVKDYILYAHRLVENIFPHWKLRTKKIPFQNSTKYETSVVIFLLFFC